MSSPSGDVSRPWPAPATRGIVLLGRLGFLARGSVYFVIGLLAGLAAIGAPAGAATDARGAATLVEALPGGTFLIILAALGVSGYALWRWVEAIFNLERLKGLKMGLGLRVLFGFDGVFHASFALMLFAVAGGVMRGSAEADADHWTARVLSETYGAWLVGLGGAVAIIVAGCMLYRAYTVRHRELLQRDIANSWQATVIVTTSRVGETTRCVILTIVGIFLIRAAWFMSPHETLGPAGAMVTLAQQPGGRLWLGLTALGFIAYPTMSVLEGRYRKLGHGELAPPSRERPSQDQAA